MCPYDAASTTVRLVKALLQCIRFAVLREALNSELRTPVSAANETNICDTVAQVCAAGAKIKAPLLLQQWGAFILSRRLFSRRQK